MVNKKTYKQACEILGVTKMTLIKYVKELKIEVEKTSDRFYISEEDVYYIMNYLCDKKAKREKITLEEMKKLHPLVKDERCFDINYWAEQ